MGAMGLRIRSKATVLSCILFLGINGSCALTATVEHSFDGQTFKEIASLDIDEIDSSTPLDSYAQVLSTDSSKLLDAASGEGLYYVRVTPPGSQSVIASIPARCWASAGSSAQLTIHTLDSGSLVAASLSAPCPAVPAPGKVQVNLPQIDSARIIRPLPAPQLSLPASPPGAKAGAMPQANLMVGSPAAGQQQQQQGEGQDGKKAPPPKDERSWVQKNWLPMALVAFMIANRLGQAANPPQGAPPPGRALPAGAPRPRQ